jgi:hypothetical protein
LLKTRPVALLLNPHNPSEKSDDISSIKSTCNHGSLSTHASVTLSLAEFTGIPITLGAFTSRFVHGSISHPQTILALVSFYFFFLPGYPK